MSENRGALGPLGGCSPDRETVCIDTFRVLDSCRDRDCYEDVRVYLCPFGQEIVDRNVAVRTKEASILWTYVGVDPVPFNRGFYQVTVRFYIKVTCEACVGLGRNQEFSGIAVVEKKVVLYGSIGNVNIFRSDPNVGPCDACEPDNRSTNVPVGVCEVVNPVLLSARVVEPKTPCGYCCCCCADIPASVSSAVSGNLTDGDDRNRLLVTIGIFSVIRIERPAQYLIKASDYCVPDKECVAQDEDDPCSLFRKMAFPVGEFCPPSRGELVGSEPDGGNRGNCGCGKH